MKEQIIGQEKIWKGTSQNVADGCSTGSRYIEGYTVTDPTIRRLVAFYL